jgi:hypothetical protein
LAHATPIAAVYTGISCINVGIIFDVRVHVSAELKPTFSAKQN